MAIAEAERTRGVGNSIWPRVKPLDEHPIMSRESMHDVSGATQKTVERIEERMQPNRFQQLFDEIHWQFAIFPVSVVKEIYRAEKRTLKQHSNQKPDPEKAAIAEVPNPTLEDRLQASRNSGISGSGKVFIIKSPRPAKA